MNAHSFAMQNLFIALGFTLMNQIGIFGPSISSNAGAFSGLVAKLTNPIITIAGIQVTGIILIAGALAATTIVFLNTSIVTAQGTSMIIYASIFYGSVFLVGADIFETFAKIPMMSFLYGAYVLIGSLAFVYTLIQMGSGGQKMMD